jgi:alpha-galactosidase
LVRQGRRVSNDGGINVWRKDLVDGSVAVAVYNSRNETGGAVELVFESVGFSSVDRVEVRDLINHRAMGMHTGSMVVPPLPAHGVALYNVSIVWVEQHQRDGGREL